MVFGPSFWGLSLEFGVEDLGLLVQDVLFDV